MVAKRKTRKPRKREPIDDKFEIDEASRAGKTPSNGAIEVLARILVDIYLKEEVEDPNVPKTTNV